jgi:hypothetical protein
MQLIIECLATNNIFTNYHSWKKTSEPYQFDVQSGIRALVFNSIVFSDEIILKNNKF